MQKLLLCVAVVLAALLPTGARAALSLSATRVVHVGDHAVASLRIRNESELPVLVQAWVDDGDASQSPEHAAVPFVVVPPLLRLESDQARSLSVRPVNAGGLPQDRESLFWLNLLEVPQAVKQGESRFQINARSRLKLFHRPSGLPGSASMAAAALQWQLQAGANGAWQLEVRNPTAFHVNVAGLSVATKAHLLPVAIDLLAPFSTRALPLPDAGEDAPMLQHVDLQWIDDAGQIQSQRFVLGRERP